ncbi:MULTISPECIES: hypothetical protein [Streptomyces]|uniref:Uncharacterized protein n=1 Tax=Streptomyces griseocarneus TaxID=51201 RepID=A0ABX7RKC7_9ACTN|nr:MULTISPECIES: hypothetical protein [Streptomyces]QSY48711.1 hypothetical protein J3S04_27275 [Streptomyces griseocarneus]
MRLGLVLLTGALPDRAAARSADFAAPGRASPAVSAPSETNALALAKRSGRNVEVESLRAETSDVVARADGRLEAREYLRPVRARIGGEWKPVDATLEKGAGGGVSCTVP